MKKALFASAAALIAMTQFGCGWDNFFGAWNVAALDVATVLDFLNIAPFN